MSQPILVHHHHRAIAMWLVVCLLLVAFMVAVGGYTRLSGSGLSITEWKPIHGTLPPMGAHEWEEEFENYLNSPQGRTTNAGISFEEFQTIFWPEYWHRVLGRAIGVVFLLPLIAFAFMKSISKRFGLRLTAIFALGGLQGLAGWLMVASGLVNDPHVSHIRLAIHLSLAFALLGLILWALLGVQKAQKALAAGSASLEPSPMANSVGFAGGKIYHLWFGLLCLQIILGAFVAGLKAGLVYNTWPTMNGMWFPPELWASETPAIENIALIQFLHRKLAIIIALGFILWWYLQRKYVKNARLTKQCLCIGLILIIQFKLGVLALLNHIALPLALAHQMVGLALFAAAVWLLYGLKNR